MCKQIKDDTRVHWVQFWLPVPISLQLSCWDILILSKRDRSRICSLVLTGCKSFTKRLSYYPCKDGWQEQGAIPKDLLGQGLGHHQDNNSFGYHSAVSQFRKGIKTLDIFMQIVSTVHNHILKKQNSYSKEKNITSHIHTSCFFMAEWGKSNEFKDIIPKIKDSKIIFKVQYVSSYLSS